MTTLQERALACFKGLVVADAIGKQTETLSPVALRRWYPDGIHGFDGRPGEVIPRYRGKRYEWRIGETTDDTEQTIAVAKALLQNPNCDHVAIGRELLGCRKSLHPGVSMWTFIESGDPARIAPAGDGCGAAMRVAPVGVVHSSLERIVRGSYECSIPTHGGQSAVCAAAAVAGAISAALNGQSSERVLEAALAASHGAESLRPQTRQHTIAQRIAQIHTTLATRCADINFIAENCFPNSPENIVPLAIGLALTTESASETTLIAANVGGDADSVASIGAAIAGAMRPDTINESWFETVRLMNGLDIEPIVRSLAMLR